MKKRTKIYLPLALACASLLAVSAAQAQPPLHSASSQRQRSAIEGVIANYERALNAGDVDAVVSLYTDDAVLMPPNAPDAVGIDAVRAAYIGIFNSIELNLAFDIAEVQCVSQEWAFLRSTSNGTLTVKANGAVIPSSNHELFVLQKVRGEWKIARYSFSSTQPAA